MSRRHIVVVGGSLAGLRTVEALRRLGNDARITLVGDENTLPYDRPPLSKEILLGKAEAEAVGLTTSQQLADLDVDVRLGEPATGLDLAARTVRVGRDDLPFDDLLIATGARARHAEHLESRKGLYVLRTLDDALAIRGALEDCPRVAILGGGFIGAEVASAARDLGLDVAVIDVAPVLMHRGLGTAIGQRMTDVARHAGVSLWMEETVTEIVGESNVEAVRLSSGTLLNADVLVVGMGSVPNTEWLHGSGLTLDDGVVCDSTLAAAPGIYAAGDVARWMHPVYGSLRCEHWTTAGEHADAVASTMSGTPTISASVPYVWSDQFGHKLQVAGIPQRNDDVRFIVDEPEKFVATTGSNGSQHAAVALNAPGALIRQRMKLATRPPWDKETA